jgi:hypothetical protein
MAVVIGVLAIVVSWLRIQFALLLHMLMGIETG